MYIVIGIIIGMLFGGIMCSIAYKRCCITQNSKYLMCDNCGEKVWIHYIPHALLWMFKGGWCNKCHTPLKSCWAICELIITLGVTIMTVEAGHLIDAIVANGFDGGALVNIIQSISSILILLTTGMLGVQEWFCESYGKDTYSRYNSAYKVINTYIMVILCIVCTLIQIYQAYFAVGYDITVSKSVLRTHLIVTAFFDILLLFTCITHRGDVWKYMSLCAICANSGITGVMNTCIIALVMTITLVICEKISVKAGISSSGKVLKIRETPMVLCWFTGFAIQMVMTFVNLGF